MNMHSGFASHAKFVNPAVVVGPMRLPSVSDAIASTMVQLNMQINKTASAATEPLPAHIDQCDWVPKRQPRDVQCNGLKPFASWIMYGHGRMYAIIL